MKVGAQTWEPLIEAEQSRTRRWILNGRQNGNRLRAGRWVTPASDTSNLTGRGFIVKEFSSLSWL